MRKRFFFIVGSIDKQTNCDTKLSATDGLNKWEMKWRMTSEKKSCALHKHNFFLNEDRFHQGITKWWSKITLSPHFSLLHNVVEQILLRKEHPFRKKEIGW